MSFNVPAKIKIVSDENEIELVNTIQKSKSNNETLYVYRFYKSLSKEGMECMFTETVLRKLLKNTFKIIE